MPTTFHVFVGWDHAVYTHIQDLVLETLKAIPSVASVKHFGPRDTSNRVDYPDVAAEVCNHINEKNAELISNNKNGAATNEELAVGILMCGSGIGISIAANKMPGIRAALCHDYYTAQMCRQHNNANILCFGARTTGPEVMVQMINVFFTEAFAGEGTRHAGRVEKIHALEGVKKQSE